MAPSKIPPCAAAWLQQQAAASSSKNLVTDFICIKFTFAEKGVMLLFIELLLTVGSSFFLVEAFYLTFGDRTAIKGIKYINLSKFSCLT